MIQIAIGVAASVLLVASFITFEPPAGPGTVALDTGERAAPLDMDSAGAHLPVLPQPSSMAPHSIGTRLPGSGKPPPPAEAYTGMMFRGGA